MPTIHPTSVVEPGAQLAADVVIGPFCHVGPKAVLGPGTRLLSHVSIQNRTTLGRGNVVFPQAVLGALPQDLKYRGEDAELIIGDENQIREAVTMHIGTANGGGVTRVGSHNLIMVGCHVAHDCILGDHIIMANAVQLAGHIVVEDHATLGGAAAVHHFVTFGAYSFTGGTSRIVHDVPPFMTIEGNPAEVRGVNAIGLERRGFAPEHIQHLKEAYRRLWRAPKNMPTTMADRLTQLERDFPDDPHIARLVQFLRRMAQGVFGRSRESQRPDNRRQGAVVNKP